MTRARKWPAAIGVTAGVAGPVWGQAAQYSYVKMSLTVPWTLYFLFLACVLIPFVVMIVLAWRRTPPSPDARRAAIDAPSERAP